MSVIRLLRDGEFGEFLRIRLNAYPAMYTTAPTEEQRANWIESMKTRQSEEGATRYYGCFREEKLVGCMILDDFRMTLYDGHILVGGVGDVCVDLLRKKEHVAKEMMEYFHKHYREKGACLTALYPFRPDFYRKMGYGYGAKMSQYRFRPDDLPSGPKERVSYLDQSHLKLVWDCYNRYAGQTHGMIEAKEVFFKQLLQRFKVIGYKKGDSVEGFLAFNFKKLSEEHQLLQDIAIRLLVYENPEALMALLGFLRSQSDQVNRIRLNTMDEDFHFLLQDPRNGNPHMFHTSQESNVQGVGIMYRVINTAKLFQELRGHNFNGQSLRVKLNVVDTFLPENNGPVTVNFVKGVPKLTDGSAHDVEATLDVSWFSSLIMGVIDMRKLWEFKLVRLSDKSYLDRLDRLFHSAKKPVTIEDF